MSPRVNRGPLPLGRGTLAAPFTSFPLIRGHSPGSSGVGAGGGRLQVLGCQAASSSLSVAHRHLSFPWQTPVWWPCCSLSASSVRTAERQLLVAADGQRCLCVSFFVVGHPGDSSVRLHGAARPQGSQRHCSRTWSGSPCWELVLGRSRRGPLPPFLFLLLSLSLSLSPSLSSSW